MHGVKAEVVTRGLIGGIGECQGDKDRSLHGVKAERVTACLRKDTAKELRKGSVGASSKAFVRTRG